MFLLPPFCAGGKRKSCTKYTGDCNIMPLVANSFRNYVHADLITTVNSSAPENGLVFDKAADIVALTRSDPLTFSSPPGVIWTCVQWVSDQVYTMCGVNTETGQGVVYLGPILESMADLEPNSTANYYMLACPLVDGVTFTCFTGIVYSQNEYFAVGYYSTSTGTPPESYIAFAFQGTLDQLTDQGHYIQYVVGETMTVFTSLCVTPELDMFITGAYDDGGKVVAFVYQLADLNAMTFHTFEVASNVDRVPVSSDGGCLPLGICTTDAQNRYTVCGVYVPDAANLLHGIKTGVLFRPTGVPAMVGGVHGVFGLVPSHR